MAAATEDDMAVATSPEAPELAVVNAAGSAATVAVNWSVVVVPAWADCTAFTKPVATLANFEQGAD